MILQAAEYEEFMGKIRNHKLICIVLMAAIMISGICLNDIKANSFFSCHKESRISTPDSLIEGGSVYRTEELNEREVISSIRQVRTGSRRVNSRIEQEIDPVWFDVDILPHKFQSISAMEERLYYDNLCCVAILKYIHKQDGEKVSHFNFI